MLFKPHAYQIRAIDFVLRTPYCALFMDMGLGKSIVTLTAINRLMNDSLDVDRVLVVAPKSVAQNTWSNEAGKWDHCRHLRLSLVMGTAAQRTAALDADADIYVTNRDNVVWLVRECLDHRKAWPFDCVVLDESSSFKNYSSKRWKALWRARPLIRRMVLLTGTPAPNGLMDLWSQVKLLDNGARLGAYITQFRQRWFHPGAHNGAVVYEYVPNKGAREDISARISDICLSMQASDYLDMPKVIDGGVDLQLPELRQYRKFEKDCVMDLRDGSEILAVTAVSLANKLMQFTGGAVYDDEHSWHEVSTAKMEALLDILEATSEPVLVYYNYIHERERICAQVPDAVCFKGEPDILTAWNDGRIRVLLCHPASVAYGLNMQQGGHIIVWYSPTWNLELYQQANARLLRQGQTKPVVIYHLVCKDTMDETVMGALRRKDDTQDAILQHIKSLTK